MSEKAHNVTSLNTPAPETPEDGETQTEKVPGRMKTFLANNKKFFIGAGTGIAAGLAILAVAKSADEEEQETEETPED